MSLKIRTFSLVMATVLGAGTAQGAVGDNAAYEQAYRNWAAAHFALLPVSFLPGPFGAIADLASIGIDIRIKTLPPTLVTTDPDPVLPNSPDGCFYDFYLPRKEGGYENLFGLVDIKGLPTNWGALSDPVPPSVGHANAAVKLRVDNFYLDAWEDNVDSDDSGTIDKTVVFPSGNHTISWIAATQLDPLIDVAIPFALFIISNEVKYLRTFFTLQTDPRTAARALEIGGLFLINAGIEAGVIAAGQIDSNIPIDTAKHSQDRNFLVFDVNPPQISYDPPMGTASPVVLEANSFGGERWALHQGLYRSWISATDPCAAPLVVGSNAPFLLPLGPSQIEWEAVDVWPVGGSNTGRATVIQEILVQDTRPPIILVPPSRVIESGTPPSIEDIDIGTAVVFDVADPDPLVSNTVPGSFPINSRTEVIWTATDSSGNVDSKSQWITVKVPGSNNPPNVSDINGSTLTAMGVDLELTGSDPDFISGRFDPLMFDILMPPSNGFFVSPLMPYFIEDYRVRPSAEVGGILNTSSNPSNDLYDAFCGSGNPGVIPLDFVFKPKFIHVTDTGIQYVLDQYWKCDAGGASAVTDDRISKWSSTGLLLDQVDIPATDRRITLDQMGRIYAVTPAGGNASSSPMFLSRYSENLDFETSYRFTVNSPTSIPSLRSAKLDAQSGLIYATDRRRVHVYDSNDVASNEPAFVGSLESGNSFLSGQSVAGSSSAGYTIEIDLTGSVYIVDSGDDRIFKFAPSTFDGAVFTPGDLIGWMGRCDSGPGCDDVNGRSFGYSCSVATPCTVTVSAGSGPGQFDVPAGIALDPEDILYVTDYDNSRVQRFTPLGDFAGEASSVCDGSCFVLGDMGRPLDISVNSTQFFVLDRDRDLMHVFETAPFKDITENSVIVEYASNNDFQGTDSFTFGASDGLALSNAATATILVNRNFRPPVALYDALSTDEDTALVFNLLAIDPDGILGIDFNGLDTLEYSVVQGPQFGTLSGNGVTRTYTPDPDYNGEDSLVFRANDGLSDSSDATVWLSINPVGDAPVVRLSGQDSSIMPKAIREMLLGKIVGTGMQAGLGYTVPLMAEFDDPDLDEAHFLQITWGDGFADWADQNPPADPMNPGNDPIITQVIRGTGQIIGQHVYHEPGNMSVNVLVMDDGDSKLTGDVSADITVVPMVDVALEAVPDPADPVRPGQVARLLVNVSNQPPEQPDPGSGLPPITELDATGVEFVGILPVGVQLVGFSTSQGSCLHSNDTTTCQIGTLTPTQSVTITLDLLPNENFDPGLAGYRISATLNEPDPSTDNLSVVEIPVLPQVVFADGLE